ncbi:hypothetical protein FHT02_004059 [Sphingomonas xinjiangensis]|uniref:Uncharacterized protein n=1 Tax=Sphingomonas xinjiangensis TaxID=643568 RepID=A0A840YSZ8_9SPHN|nr:hypothetical protein [Sphingomonas xinjiangensis]
MIVNQRQQLGASCHGVVANVLTSERLVCRYFCDIGMSLVGGKRNGG